MTIIHKVAEFKSRIGLKGGGKQTNPEEPRMLPITGTYDEVQKYFLDNRMTDGLPIVIPTEEKVMWMLTGTSHRLDEIVAEAFKMGMTENGLSQDNEIRLFLTLSVRRMSITFTILR